MARTIGAFIFPMVWEAWSLEEATRRLQALQDFGVNTIATESEIYRDNLIELAHRLGMQFVGGIACFSEHGRSHQLLYRRPELWPLLENGEHRPLMEWYLGVTPTFDDYNEARLDVVEQIMRDHELDGMCLDFIRWPLHWELELRPDSPEPLQSSFDPHTVSRFLEFAQLELPPDCASAPKQAAWILGQHRNTWTNFKCDIITEFVAQAQERIRLHRPAASLGMYLVPAPDDRRAYLVGQRVRDLAPITDFLAPMVYHPVLHQTPEWAAHTIEALIQLAPGKILPVLQVDSAEGAEMGADWGPPVPVEDWRKVASNALKQPDTLGITAFTGTSLFVDNRGNVLADCLV